MRTAGLTLLMFALAGVIAAVVMAAGMSDVLHKPLDAQALLQTVGRQICQHRSAHGLED